MFFLDNIRGILRKDNQIYKEWCRPNIHGGGGIGVVRVVFENFSIINEQV